jgi:hypothetical protein
MTVARRTTASHCLIIVFGCNPRHPPRIRRMPPIALTDAQLTAVFDAAKPLPRASRDAFLLDLAAALQGISDPGDGDVSRAIRTVQRKHFDPPNLTDGRAQPHPGRGPRQDRVTSRRPADYGHDTDTKESCLPRVSVYRRTATISV